MTQSDVWEVVSDLVERLSSVVPHNTEKVSEFAKPVILEPFTACCVPQLHLSEHVLTDPVAAFV